MKMKLWHWVVALVVGVPIVMMLTASPAPDIPQTAIDMATSTIMMDPQVVDATVVVDGRDVGLAIVVRRSTSPEYGRQLADNYARLLSGQASFYSDDKRLKEGPSRDYLGSLWDHYDLRVVVAFDADNVLVQGAKARTAAAIRW